MKRRAFLKSAAAAGVTIAAGALRTPAIAQRAAAGTIRLVPHADVANFDPIWTSAYIARNAGTLVWDTLYGMDSRLQIRRQMIESEELSADGLVWTFKLRPGLRFHDGTPVLAKDAVASLNRWAVRDSMGQMIKAIENELSSIDDRSFRWSLKRPYPKMLLALGKLATPCCFIMPARIAATDPFKQITDYTGSGPMRFARSEWLPGARAVFERFADYQPRDEAASWLAGGKRIIADRIEWITIADPATRAAALQNGEVDWLEQVHADLVPLLQKSRDVAMDIQDPLGTIGYLMFNHLHPPFNDLRARRAMLAALSQEDYMRAIKGDDDALWKPLPGFITPGTRLYTESGGEILKGKRDLDGAKRLLSEAGYSGQAITCMAAQDNAEHKAWGDVTVELLSRLGTNVDYASVDWGTVVARRTQKSAPGHGGWHMYITTMTGVEGIDASNRYVRANGDKASFGWPNIPDIETEVAAWYDAKSDQEEKSIVGRWNKVALDQAVCAPLGFYLRHTAWRKNVTGIAQGPIPFFWGVGKTA